MNSNTDYRLCDLLNTVHQTPRGHQLAQLARMTKIEKELLSEIACNGC